MLLLRAAALGISQAATKEIAPKAICIFDSNFTTATFISKLKVIIPYKATAISNPKPKLQSHSPLSTRGLLPKAQLH